ncbi:MAG: hypothetical protein GC158_09350 [Cyanobacteria bacterium RI_101]|nr:hypothetical protein [Cyanobacteria bacterium RI_101]
MTLDQNLLFSQTQADLARDDYAQAIDLLSRHLTEFPQDLGAYWLLGLAHFLAGHVETAEGCWWAGLTQKWESGAVESAVTLESVLENEARRREEKGEFALARRLREQLFSLAPEDADNILRLSILDLRLNQYDPELLENLNLVEALQKAKIGTIAPALLQEALSAVLSFPAPLSLDILAAAIPHLQGTDWLTPVMAVANSMAYDRRIFRYAIHIAKICLEFLPDNLYLLNDLIKYYGLRGDQENLIATARVLWDKLALAEGQPALKCYFLSRLLSAFLAGNDWQAVEQLVEAFESSLELLLTSPKPILDDFLLSRFWALAFVLLYRVDNPGKIRRYLNHTAQIFQSNTAPIPCSLDLNLRRQPLRRIGYIAHTLRRHSVGWLSRWLFRYHDSERFEIYVYLITQEADELTENWIYPYVKKSYHFGRDAQDVIRQIQADQIQILVDLDGLTHNITAQVLAHKPAPLQVSWLGSDASGLPAIDYFIVDPHVIPPDAQDYYRETLWRLPQTYLALDGFEVGAASLSRDSLGLAEEAVIYLSVQNKIKFNPQILRLQLEILRQVPQSVFLIKGGKDNDLLRQRILATAQTLGVDPQRLYFLPADPDEETHRANLALADVVLDTYPYNGATTTLETLWMGVPLVTRVGEQFSARNSYAFLRQVGVREGVAWTDREYVEWGTRLGRETELRQWIRTRLLAARETAPLWQGEIFTRHMEIAYQSMWDQ